MIDKCILVLLSVFIFSIVFAATDLEAQTWQRMKMELPSGYDRISIISARFTFATKDIGWLYTSVFDSATGNTSTHCLFKTTNGGDNWFVQRDYDDSRSFKRPIFALDTNHVWVGLARSTDGGNTWPDSISTQPNRLDYTEILFFDSLSGVAVGTIPGTTTDGGKTWTSHDSIPEMLYPTKLSFPTSTQGWATCDGHPGVTDAGSIIHTSDGGATWTFQYPPPPMYTFPRMGSIEFLDSLNGFAYSGRMYTTTDGGASWVVQPNSPYGGDFAFLTDNICCLTGTYGVFWYSVDRCKTWISDTTEYMAGFKLFPIRKEGYMFAWGTRSDNYYRELLRGDFRSLTMVEERSVPIGNTGITINAHPNPFYDELTMNIHGSTGHNIHISVRDLLGREVFHEAASIPYSGVYTLRWKPNAIHRSCGSYLVTVSSQHSMVSAIMHRVK